MPPKPMPNQRWQQQLLQTLVERLEGDEDVLLLGVLGSLLRPELVDRWSDVDVLLVVRDRAAARFFPTLDWLAPLGTVYAYEQFATEDRWTTRVCFDDFRRLDIVMTTLTKAVEAERLSQPLFPGERMLLISRSRAATAALPEPSPDTVPAPPSPEAFQEMVNGFWFKAVVAVTKVVRGDLLIGVHLALELIQECCVLGMMIRDRATGTTHHRSGGMGNQIVSCLPSLKDPSAALNLLETISESGALFDHLAHAWTDDGHSGSGHQARRKRFEGFVKGARQAVERDHR